MSTLTEDEKKILSKEKALEERYLKQARRAEKMNKDRSTKWTVEIYVDTVHEMSPFVQSYLDRYYRVSAEADARNAIWSEDFRTLKMDLLICKADPTSTPQDQRKILLNAMIRHALSFSDEFFEKEGLQWLSTIPDCLFDDGFFQPDFLSEDEQKDWFKVLATEAYEKAKVLRQKIVYPQD